MLGEDLTGRDVERARRQKARRHQSAV
jgi:hypothetical protein